MATTTLTVALTTPAQGQLASGVTVVSTTGFVNEAGAVIGGFQGFITAVTSGTQFNWRNDDAPTGVVIPIGAIVVAPFPIVPVVPLVCAANALVAASACFGPQCLGPDDREAIELIAMVNELAASGGINYVSNFSKLLADSASWSILNEDQRRSIVTYVTVVNAINAGASITLNINSLRTAAACALCLPWEQKKNVKMYLKCLLNSMDDPGQD